MQDPFTTRRQPAAETIQFDLGQVFSEGPDRPITKRQRFTLTWQMLAVHLAILGQSGSGKSKLLELLMRYFIRLGLPFLCIDPANDMAYSIASFVAAQKAQGDDEMWRNFHFLELRPDTIFAYDPFANAPLRGAVSAAEYHAWLSTRVDRVYRAFLRRVSEADRDVMMRQQRWLKNIIEACGVAIDGRNTHVGLDKMLIFADPQRPEFEALFEMVAPHLQPHVRADFRKLIETKRVRDQEQWVESSINRLRDIMKGLVPSLFSPSARVLNVQRIIEDGGWIVAALGQNQQFSHDQKVTVGGLLIDDMLMSKEADEEAIPADRTRCALIVDEVGEFLGDDLERSFATHRKYNLSVIVGGQNLSTLCRGDLDMAERVLSQCGTKICFQQVLDKDLEILVPALCYQNISFEKHFQVMDRPDGHEIIELEDRSDSSGRGKSWSQGTKKSTGGSESSQLSRPVDGQVNEGTRSNGKTQSSERAESTQSGGQENETHTVSHKKVPLAKTREEWHETSQLKDAVADQFHWWKQQLHGFNTAECLVKARGIKLAFCLRVAEVKEWWANDRDKYTAIDRLRQHLFQLHPYYITPVVTNEEDATVAPEFVVNDNEFDGDPDARKEHPFDE